VNWASATWPEFERAVTEYRDREYTGVSAVSGENAYLALFTELADVPISGRAAHIDSLVLFLNRWKCHIPTKTDETRAALREWLEREEGSLDALADVTLLDAALPAYQRECERLYESLIALRSNAGPRIPTMGDAAASKILHQMVPSLFVMWDKEIKKSLGYGEFMLLMHEFGLRLRDELAPEEAHLDIEGYLNRTLGYPVRKPLAKYIDEYNWWLAWGLGAAAPMASEGEA
jgi:hypothetical protein